MAATLVQISGSLFDKVNKTQQQVLLVGELSLVGVGIGGGPIIPDPKPPTDPPGIWGGGNAPFPTPPIPIYPGGTPNPPGIWPGPGPLPHPEHPIVLPPDGGAIPPGTIMPPAVGVPVKGYMVYLQGVGYVFVPEAVLKPSEPPTEPPVDPPVEGDDPHVEHRKRK